MISRRFISKQHAMIKPFPALANVDIRSRGNNCRPVYFICDAYIFTKRLTQTARERYCRGTRQVGSTVMLLISRLTGLKYVRLDEDYIKNKIAGSFHTGLSPY